MGGGVAVSDPGQLMETCISASAPFLNSEARPLHF